MGPDRVKVTRSNPCGMSCFFSACMHCLRLLKNASQKKEAQKKLSCNIVSPTGAGEKRRRIKSWCCNYPAGAAVISPSPPLKTELLQPTCGPLYQPGRIPILAAA